MNGVAKGGIGRAEGQAENSGMVDVPLEFEGEVAGAGAMAKACHVKGSSAASRHGFDDASVWLMVE